MEIKGERERDVGTEWKKKKNWEQKVDVKSAEVEECILVGQVKTELWYDQSV